MPKIFKKENASPFRDSLQQQFYEAMVANHQGLPFLGQGATGIGKTYLSYRYASECQGQCIIALPSNNLIKQTFNKHLDYPELNLTERVKRFYPLSAYVSPTKCEKINLQVTEGEFVEDVILRYQDQFQLFPHEICLDGTSPHKERQFYYQHQDANLQDAKIILTTHMAILNDAWTDHQYLQLPYQHIIVDEADQIYAMAKLKFNKHLYPQDFELIGFDKPSFNLPTMQAMLEQTKQQLKEKNTKDRNQLLNLFSSLNCLIAHFEREQTYFTMGVENDAWHVYFKNPSKIINKLHEQHQLLYLSGTLWLSDDVEQGKQTFGRLIGTKNHSPHSAQFSHSTLYTDLNQTELSFGALKFVQVKPLTGREAEEFHQVGYDHEKHPSKTDFKLTQAVIEQVDSERTLCLVPSKADALELQQRLPQAVVQTPHENAQTTIQRYLEKDTHHVLILYSGWAGVDIEGVKFKHLIIPRIPYPHTNELDPEPFYSYQSWVTRKMNQGFGRAIRGKDDVATVWILDRRFPMPSADYYQACNSGVTGHLPLLDAVPERFRKRTKNKYNYGIRYASMCELVDGKLKLYHYK